MPRTLVNITSKMITVFWQKQNNEDAFKDVEYEDIVLEDNTVDEQVFLNNVNDNMVEILKNKKKKCCSLLLFFLTAMN